MTDLTLRKVCSMNVNMGLTIKVDGKWIESGRMIISTLTGASPIGSSPIGVTQRSRCAWLEIPSPTLHHFNPPHQQISQIAANASMTTQRMPLTDISNNDMTTSPAASGSRRKSGRAVKAPEKFVPEVASSQVGPPSAKRKRGENAENDASESEEDPEEENEESDTPVEEDSAGEEELKAARRKTKTKARVSRKPAAKKPKTNGTAPQKLAPAIRLPSRPKKAKKVAIADKAAEGLYGRHLCVLISLCIDTDRYPSGYIHERSPLRRCSWTIFKRL